MAVITLSNIKKSFGKRDLFEDVSFFINERERAALIGANGTGKTTLLRIICGEQPANFGTLTMEPGITVGYLPQDVDLPDTASLHLAVMGVTPELLACAGELAFLEKKIENATDDEAHGLGSRYAEISHQFDTLNGYDYQIRARAILLGLGFDESDFDKPVHTLSGGQKTRAALARLLLKSPDLLLLDEPTNHLDISACEWLQDFLQTRYQGAALIVSHDRYFLDQVVSKVVELENGTTATFIGNYASYARQKAARIEEQQKLYKLQQKEITRIETAIQTLFSDRKFSRRDSKVKQLERIKKIDSVHAQKTVSVSISANIRSGREVIRLSKLAKSFPDKNLFSDVDFVVERGAKLGIVGPNGSGKTTLLKIIADRSLPDNGEVIFGHNVDPVYFAQEFDHLVPSHTVLEELLVDANISAKQARDLLAKFLFMGDDSFKTVSMLSGGELCRLALAKVIANSPNLLLLDEPTNHLDIASREALEDALRSFSGTVVVASHDRYLLNAIASEIVEIKDGKFTSYLGNYSDYHEKTRTLTVEVNAKTTGQKLKASAACNRSNNTHQAVEAPKSRPISSLREMERLHRELKKRLKELETEIHTVEERIQELTAALGDEENYRSGLARELTQEYNKLTSRLESLYAEWESVCLGIAEIEESNASV